MLINIDPTQVVLEIHIENFDGTSKTDIASGNVRVYHVTGAGETDDLSSTPLVSIGAGVWRYRWVPVSLAEGYYIAEYTLTDNDGKIGVFNEDIFVGYLESEVLRILGLVQENFRIKDQVYGTYGGRSCLESATLRIYPTALDCTNDTNHIAEYTVTATYDVDGNCTSYITPKA